MTRRQKIRTTIGVIGFIVIALPAISAWMILARKSPPPAELDLRTTVEALALRPARYLDVIRAVGAVDPVREAVLSAQVNAAVLETCFERGAFVEAGAVILRLDPADLDHQLVATGARLEEAELKLALTEELYRSKLRTEDVFVPGSQEHRAADGLVTKKDGTIYQRTDLTRTLADFKSAQAGVKSLAAERARLEDMRAKCEVIAPFSGYLQSMDVTIGESVTIGRRLCAMIDLSELNAVIGLGDLEASAVSLGDGAMIAVDATQQRYPGVVAGISPGPDEGTQRRRFQVDVRLGNPDREDGRFEQGAGLLPPLRAGWTCRVTVQLGASRDQVLAVPPEALVLRRIRVITLAIPRPAFTTMWPATNSAGDAAGGASAREFSLLTPPPSRHEEGERSHGARVLGFEDSAASEEIVARSWIYETAGVAAPTAGLLPVGSRVGMVADQTVEARVVGSVTFEEHPWLLTVRARCPLMSVALSDAAWQTLGRSGGARAGDVFALKRDQDEAPTAIAAAFLGHREGRAWFFLDGGALRLRAAALAAKSDASWRLAARIEGDALVNAVTLKDPRFTELDERPELGRAKLSLAGFSLPLADLERSGRNAVGRPIFAPLVAAPLAARTQPMKGELIPDRGEQRLEAQDAEPTSLVPVTGVAPGAWVIISGHERLGDGDPVRVIVSPSSAAP